MSRILIVLAAAWLFAGGFSPATSSACDNEFSPQRSCKPCKRPDGSLNHPPNITSLVVDKSMLKLKPLPDGPPPDEPVRSPDMMVNVTTTAEDAENDVLDYYYTVSGGRIVGSGANVQWDLNGVAPGTYTLRAGVDDSCGVCGKTMMTGVMIVGKTPVAVATPKPVPAAPPVVSATPAASASPKAVTGPSVSAPSNSSVRPRTANTVMSSPASAPVSTKPSPSRESSTSASEAKADRSASTTVARAPTSVTTARPPSVVTNRPTASVSAVPSAAAPCSCPKVMISDPERSGSDLIFTTKVFDSPATNRLTYIWTISGGTVISQDGRSIRVKPGVLGGSVTVLVNGFEPKCNCPSQAQKTF